jgi:predicted nucleic-acid-binding protein
VKITPDTNVLVRAIVGDEPAQGKIAQSMLADAELIAITVPALCELVWVLSQGYKTPLAMIGEVIRGLINTENVVMNRAAVEAGLDFVNRGGDFADGVIAYEGRWLGAEAFVSFDKKAVKMIKDRGGSARLLL